MLDCGVPPPGERRGENWWSAMAEVEALAVPESAPVILHTGGAGAESIEIGSAHLVPGPRFTKREGAGADESLVAICLATHEPPPDLLRRQIESITKQTHERWHCVISDDASSPERLSSLLEIVGTDDRFTVVQGNERVGVYRNFERAIAAAPEEAGVIALADQDDEWYPDKLSALIERLSGDALLVHSDARVVDASGAVVSPSLWPGGAPSHLDFGRVLLANPVSGASSMFKRELLEWAMPFPAIPGRAFHDRWLALTAAALGGITRVDRALYDYVQHPSAVLGQRGVAGGAGVSIAGRAGRRLVGLAQGAAPDWRSEREQIVVRSLGEAVSLRLRLGDLIGRDVRQELERIERLPESRPAQLRLLGRGLERSFRGGPGLEPALIRGLAWPRLARARATLQPSGAPLAYRLRHPGAGRVRSPGEPMRLGIVVSDVDPSSGFGDLLVAGELRAALRELGHEVRLLGLSGNAWHRQLEPLDGVVSLLDRFPADRLPGSMASVAWVRNWTERWIERPWFGSYELALGSSKYSTRLIRERSRVEAETMPLASDPERFRPRPPDPSLACDLLFVGNHWGGERAIARLLPIVAKQFSVRVFGSGWEDVAGMAELCEGPLAYERLPEAYCSAALVVDDAATHAAPYGAVNSRVFDALACGAFVASNDPAGVRELFGESFAVFSDAESLAALAREAIEDPEGVVGRTAELRRQVLERHTYAHRALQLIAAFDRLASKR
jgi:glycosyltransferase involved in cell wall biosynthesis